MTVSSKICASCSVEKPQTAFHKQGVRRHSYCADCYNARYRGKARKAADPVQRRAQNMRSRYGISPADAEAMLAGQGGVCAICKTEPTRPVVDHNHATGKARGILCHPCNVALAHVEDVEFRAAALAYLSERG